MTKINFKVIANKIKINDIFKNSIFFLEFNFELNINSCE